MTSPKEAADSLAARYGLTVTNGATPFTELGNAERFVSAHGPEVHYCWPWKKWIIWDGQRRKTTEDGEIYRRATATVRDLYQYGADLASQAADMATEPEEAAVLSKKSETVQKWARQSESRKNIEALIVLAQSRDAIPIAPAALDKDPWLLNCRNGTIDLQTGALKEHDQKHLITKMAPVDYDPAAECPIWDKFLDRIMGGDHDLVDFLQRAMGYSLTGRVSTHVLFVAYGTGRNGKSTFLDTFLDLLGPYAKKAPPELLMLKKGEAHPTERSVLWGARFVPAIETGQGRKLNETAVKEMTGGDPISTRRMREDFWEFTPTHKLWLASNHKPTIAGTDIGIWSRIRLIPFSVTIPVEERDEQLPDKLKAEWPGILAWAVRGCLDWQEAGLREPPAVSSATAEYRNDMDVLGDFLDELCVEVTGARESAGNLYDAYHSWAKDTGERLLSKKNFGQNLELRGFAKKRGTGGARIWWGVHLKMDGDAPIEPEMFTETEVTQGTQGRIFPYKAHTEESRERGLPGIEETRHSQIQNRDVTDEKTTEQMFENEKDPWDD